MGKRNSDYASLLTQFLVMLWTVSKYSLSRPSIGKQALVAVAFNCLTEIYPNPLFIDFLRSWKKIKWVREGPSSPPPPPWPQFQNLTYCSFHSSSNPCPSTSLCYPLGGCNQTSVTPWPQQLGSPLPQRIADILFTSFCPLCRIPSIWHHSLCANFCFKGQEFAKEMLAERVPFSPFCLKSPVSLISIWEEWL